MERCTVKRVVEERRGQDERKDEVKDEIRDTRGEKRRVLPYFIWFTIQRYSSHISNISMFNLLFNDRTRHFASAFQHRGRS